jgi:hypothetical protein
MKCCFGYHDWTEWTFVKKKSFMGFIELRKVKYCKRCRIEKNRYVQDISWNAKEFENIIWYHEM